MNHHISTLPMTFSNRSLIIFMLTAIARSAILSRAFMVSPPNEYRNPTNNGAVSCKPPSASALPTTTWSYNTIQKDTIWNTCLHSSVASPRGADIGRSTDDDNNNDIDCEREKTEGLRDQQKKLNQIFSLLQAEPKDLLRFEHEDDSELRGIYLNRSIKSGEMVLKLPIDSCLADDQSPTWLPDEIKNNPHNWATRLAASWIDLHLKEKQLDKIDNDNNEGTIRVDDTYEGHKLWSSLLPDPKYLRASLPVHWPETTVLSARSTALELAVDSAFFARAEAVQDLVRGIERSPYIELFSTEDKGDEQKRMNALAHRALDLVQTRSCRLEDVDVPDDSDCRRVLAPIFDFINHGSRNTGDANAYFTVEEEALQSTELLAKDTTSSNMKRKYLVVRSVKDIAQDDELKLDYGPSARPAWRCLLSYGFVPKYKRTRSDAEEGENLAEVYMKGVRYEVADDSIPIDMVADANPSPWMDEDENDLQSNEIILTADIALRIAERIANAAYYLLLEPDQILDEDENPENTPPTLFEIISKQLANSLRYSQHRILLTCAAGLTHFAKEQLEEEESSYQ